MKTNEAREKFEDILDGKEYQVYYDKSRNIFEVLWERAKEWLSDLLSNIFPSIETANGAADIILAIIVIGILILLGISIFLLVRNTKRNRNFKQNKPLHSMKELNWSYQKHFQEAMKQEEAGQYSLATRHLFLALLLYFHEKEWLEAKIWKTNWEYFDELRKVNQTWADQFYHLALVFDEVTYGEHEIGKDEYTQFREKTMVWLSDADVTSELKGERG
ncbi:DUF4129 domain-containing protein [Fredinandcohnia sp. 179-A 10B2 NHS]|uniref:DUF4129 domain-containing protein n=1 Tax=Fredinandcohnia sp. 179-A 10B2 NHS TaxID=3235176 RepID=UPI0039A00CC9